MPSPLLKSLHSPVYKPLPAPAIITASQPFLQWICSCNGRLINLWIGSSHPSPLPSSCMAAALIGNNGICSRLPTATLESEQGAAPLPRREAAVAAPLGFSLHCKRVDEKEVRRESSGPGGSKKSSRLTVGYLFNDSNNTKDKWEIILLCLDSELALHSFAMRTCHWDFMKGHI